MVRFMAEERLEDPVDIRKYNRLGYVFREELSTETEYVFVMNGYEKILQNL